MPLLNQTTNVQQIMDWCRLHTSLQNFFLFGNSQPALDICNSMHRNLFRQPMTWKFNRKVLDLTNGGFFVTQYGVQDYRHAGAVAFVLQNNAGSNPYGGVGIDLVYSATRAGGPNGQIAGITVSGGTATAQTLDPHPFQPGQIVNFAGLVDAAGIFNSTFTTNSITKTSAWTGGFTILTVPDQFHFTFAAPSNTSATITNIAITANVLTVTAANSFKVGQVVKFAGVGTNTFLNGKALAIVTASSSQFTATFANADVASGADTGTVTVCSGAPGFGTITPANQDPLALGLLIGLPAWGWGESASLQDMNSTAFPQPVKPIEMVRELAPAYSSSGNNLRLCMLIDEQQGVLRFRLSEPVSSYNFQINAFYQGKAPTLTTPQSVFAWPDDMSDVLREVALSYAFRFAKGVSAAESLAQAKIAQGAILSAMAGEERESNDQGMVPEYPLMR